MKTLKLILLLVIMATSYACASFERTRIRDEPVTIRGQGEYLCIGENCTRRKGRRGSKGD